jgi:hypothetical protein
MDITIGMVLDKLDQLGIADKTYVIYTSDHGTPGRNGPLQGGKGGLWDGGIRIPLLVRGPGAKAGAHSAVRVTGADLVPTVADLAGLGDALPTEVEGGSWKELLARPEGGMVKRPREEIVFHFPHYDKDSLGPVSAILLGDYKLIRVYEDDSRLLFDVSKDIGERNNVASSMPEVVAQLDTRLTKYLASVGAQIPTVRSGVTSSSPANTGTQSPSRRDPILSVLDRNGDGSVSAEELEKLPTILRALDKDNDGNVSRTEARAEPNQVRPNRN